MKKLCTNLLLFGISLILALGLAELACRLYLGHLDRLLAEQNRGNVLTRAPLEEVFDLSDSAGYQNRANHTVHWWGFDIRTDSLGCRVEPSAPDSARVILFLGDSMIFGVGLLDSATIPAQLQTALNRLSPDAPFRVINAGVIGYDFEQYFIHLRQLYPRLKPDLVIFGLAANDLFPSEDPFGTVLASRGFIAANAVALRRSATEEEGLWAWSKEHLYKRSGLRRLWNTVRGRQRGGTPLEWSISAGERQALEKAPQLTAAAITWLKERNVVSAYVAFPLWEQLGKPNPLIYARLLQEAGEPVLDLALSTQIQREHYFLKQARQTAVGMHFNAVGARVVAQEIAEWLVEEGIWGEGAKK